MNIDVTRSDGALFQIFHCERATPKYSQDRCVSRFSWTLLPTFLLQSHFSGSSSKRFPNFFFVWTEIVNGTNVVLQPALVLIPKSSAVVNFARICRTQTWRQCEIAEWIEARNHWNSPLFSLKSIETLLITNASRVFRVPLLHYQDFRAFLFSPFSRANSSFWRVFSRSFPRFR